MTSSEVENYLIKRQRRKERYLRTICKQRNIAESKRIEEVAKEKKRNDKIIVQVYGNMADQFDKKIGFKWYATFTFRFDKSEWSVHNDVRKFRTFLAKKNFGSKFYKRNQFIRIVYVLEKQKSGNLHVHALIADVNNVSINTAKGWFYRYHGFADIRLYDKTLGAKFYLAKSVPEGGEIEIYGNFPRLS